MWTTQKFERITIRLATLGDHFGGKRLNLQKSKDEEILVAKDHLDETVATVRLGVAAHRAALVQQLGNELLATSHAFPVMTVRDNQAFFPRHYRLLRRVSLMLAHALDIGDISIVSQIGELEFINRNSGSHNAVLTTRTAIHLGEPVADSKRIRIISKSHFKTAIQQLDAERTQDDNVLPTWKGPHPFERYLQAGVEFLL